MHFQTKENPLEALKKKKKKKKNQHLTAPVIKTVQNNYLHLNYYFKMFIQHIFSEWPEKLFLGLEVERSKGNGLYPRAADAAHKNLESS